MSAQLSLFGECKKYKCTKKKRVHYRTRSYTKKYTLKHYNEDTKETFYDSDEKHIFRIAALQSLHSLIYDYLNLPLFMNCDIPIDKNGLLCYTDEKQAEVKDTWNLSIKTRLRIHIQLLRDLRKGVSIKEAVECLKYGKKEYNPMGRD